MFKFTSQGISMSLTTIKTTKTSQETRNTFWDRFFAGPVSFFVNYEKFSKLGSRKSHFPERNFLRVFFFYFSGLESYFLKYKRNKRPERSIFEIIGKLFRVGFFRRKF